MNILPMNKKKDITYGYTTHFFTFDENLTLFVDLFNIF